VGRSAKSPARKLKTRGKCVSRVLYRVDIGDGYYVAKLEKWYVSSIQRPPRRKLACFGIPSQGENLSPKMVYARRVADESERRSFALADWPGTFSLNQLAAWKDAVKQLTDYRAKHVAWMAECKAKGADCVECEDGCKAALGIITRSLNRAVKEARG